MDDERITYFAETDARNRKVKFGIKAKDRTRHMYIIGKTGMGKSTLLENMAVQDIMNGEGMAFIDPHGKTADLLLEYVPEHRIKDVVYFAPFDTEFPISFNVLESVDADKRHLVVAGLMSTFKKIWEDAWSARMEYILTNTLLALLEYPDATLLGVNRMLSDKDYRKKVVDNVTDPSVKAFWVEEFAKYTERMAAEAVPAIQNKIGQFTANALIRNMLAQPKSSFDIRKMMDDRKIFIINLSKGRIGESNANLLGGMLITKIYLAAMSRADIPDRVLKTMPNFYLFVDEFQNFANESFADILSEARKYKLNLTIAHQYIEQMEEEVRAAVFGNVGTMITFRVGAYDAEALEKEFAPLFTMEDIVNLGQYQLYLKLMIDGVSSQPFSARTLPPIALPPVSSMQRVIESSRALYAEPRDAVEAKIIKWHEPTPPAPKRPVGAPASSATPPTTSAPRPAPAAVSQPAPTPVPQPVRTSPPVATAPVAPKVAAPVVKPMPEPSQPIQSPSSLGLGSLVKHVNDTTTEIKVDTQTQLKVAPKLPPAAVRELPPEKILARMGPDAVEAQGLVEEVVAPKKKIAPDGPLQPKAVSAPSPRPVGNTQKIADPKNVANLKNALASIMKDIPKPQPDAPKVKPMSDKPIIQIKPKEGSVPPPQSPKPPQATTGTQDTSAPREVPQNVLEDLLNVEK